MFKKRKYFPQRHGGKYTGADDEDYVLLDPKAHPKYEHAHPGTVTVDGFGLECWEHEEMKPRHASVLVNRADLPPLPARRILRRLQATSAGSLPHKDAPWCIGYTGILLRFL